MASFNDPCSEAARLHDPGKKQPFVNALSLSLGQGNQDFLAARRARSSPSTAKGESGEGSRSGTREDLGGALLCPFPSPFGAASVCFGVPSASLVASFPS